MLTDPSAARSLLAILATLAATTAARADLAPPAQPESAFLDETFTIFDRDGAPRAGLGPDAFREVQLSSPDHPLPAAPLPGQPAGPGAIRATGAPGLDPGALTARAIPLSARPGPVEAAVLIQTSFPAPRGVVVDRPAAGLSDQPGPRRLDSATAGASFAGITAAGAIIGLAIRKLPR